MGNTSSALANEPPATPASSLFALSQPRRKSTVPPTAQNLYPRRSIFAEDEDEPDDLCSTPHDAVLLGWTRTEQGIIIPQIRSIPLGRPLDDTIFNSPRLTPWVEKSTRSRSPVPSARSIHRIRQFSVESLRSAIKGELRVVNVSRPNTPDSMEECLTPKFELEHHEILEETEDELEMDELETTEYYAREEPKLESVTLKRGNSTNDSGYSTMAADTGSCSDVSEDPWWWEESAGYSPNMFEFGDSYTEDDVSISSSYYLHEERQESAYISNLLRSQPFDEWSEWRANVTNLLMIPEEDEIESRPLTPVTTLPQHTSPSPVRRRSFFNFKKTKLLLRKRQSVLW
jgi:hypothetical protein